MENNNNGYEEVKKKSESKFAIAFIILVIILSVILGLFLTNNAFRYNSKIINFIAYNDTSGELTYEIANHTSDEHFYRVYIEVKNNNEKVTHEYTYLKVEAKQTRKATVKLTTNGNISFIGSRATIEVTEI